MDQTEPNRGSWLCVERYHGLAFDPRNGWYHSLSCADGFLIALQIPIQSKGITLPVIKPGVDHVGQTLMVYRNFHNYLLFIANMINMVK